MKFQIGDIIKTKRQVLAVGNRNYPSGTQATITAPMYPTQRRWEVGMPDGTFTVMHEDDFFLYDRQPEVSAEQQEAPPAMGWFAALAESNIINGAESTASIYATLEIAAAIDRLALAVDQVVRRG